MKSDQAITQVQVKRTAKKHDRRARSQAMTENKDNSIHEEQKKIVDQFITGLYWNLYIDLFLIFSLTIAYSISLYFLEPYIAQIFLIFGIICCSIMSFNYYIDVKNEINKVLKDLEILLK